LDFLSALVKVLFHIIGNLVHIGLRGDKSLATRGWNPNKAEILVLFIILLLIIVDLWENWLRSDRREIIGL
jgi:ABC-type phosphate/phosphonate transport system permease subunit